jgi:division protein CdvB (Snf7/Vps24/ESCRT-III family)
METILPIIKVEGKMISNHIVDMEIVSSGSKKFAIMPTLKQLLIQESADAQRLYFQMKEAIAALHEQCNN